MVLELEEAKYLLGNTSINEKEIEELVKKLEVIASHVIDNLLDEVNSND